MLGAINLMEIELPIIVWLLIFIFISILVVLGGFILITLIVGCIKSLIKQIKQMRKWFIWKKNDIGWNLIRIF